MSNQQEAFAGALAGLRAALKLASDRGVVIAADADPKQGVAKSMVSRATCYLDYMTAMNGGTVLRPTDPRWVAADRACFDVLFDSTWLAGFDKQSHVIAFSRPSGVLPDTTAKARFMTAVVSHITRSLDQLASGVLHDTCNQ